MANPTETEHDSLRPLRIVVADDDGLVRDLLAAILASHGHEVELAGDGAGALARIEALPDLDLVISDMNMPGVSGLDLIRRLRAGGRDVPIIILTGNDEVRVAIEALKNGANDYLLKNEDIEDTVLISIGNVMERHRLKLENARLLVDLARKNEELERLSLLDGLTNIANRRYFDKIIAQEWGRACRERRPISVVLVDIDHFKGFNDTYGHPSGDACLCRVAEALSRSLARPGDFVARYGGEEFVAVLPDTDREGARHIAEGMRTGVAALAIPHAASSVCGHVTISLGLCSIMPERSVEHGEALRRADEALYAAKQGGRNRVVSCGGH